MPYEILVSYEPLHYGRTGTSCCNGCDCGKKSKQKLGEFISANLLSVSMALGIPEIDLSVLFLSLFKNNICLCMFSIELFTNDNFLYGITNSFGTTCSVRMENAIKYKSWRTPIEFRSFKYGQLFYLLWNDFNQDQPTEKYE